MTLTAFINSYWDEVEKVFEPYKGKPYTLETEREIKKMLKSAICNFVFHHNVPGLKQAMLSEAFNVLDKVIEEKVK